MKWEAIVITSDGYLLPIIIIIITLLATHQDVYYTQKYSVLHPYQSMNKIQGKNTALLSCQADWEDFLEKAKKVHANKYNNAVIVDKVYLPAKKKEEIIDLLREHIFSHFVVASSGRGRDSFLLQNEGIAQGSVLSTILCNMYYGSVEQELLKGVFDGSGDDANLLVRRADDFLLVSTSLNVAKKFLDNMEKGVPTLGAEINIDKTNLNFDYKHLRKLKQESPIPWCGYLFDTETLGVRFEVERFSGSKALDNLKIDSSQNPGISLKSKMKTFVRPRCTPLLLHLDINSVNRIKVNCFQIFLLGAIKTYGYILGMPQGGKTFNQVFVLECIVDLLNYSYNLVRRVQQQGDQNINKDSNNNSNNSERLLARKTCLRYGFEAFIHIFSFKFNGIDSKTVSSFVELTKRIEKTMNETLPSNEKIDAQVAKIINKAFETFKIGSFEVLP